jgi:hypothetical protein
MIFELRSSDNIVFADPTPWNRGGGEYISAPIYGAGYVYTAGMLSTLLCQSYFNGSIIKVLERLICGSQSVLHMLVPTHLTGKTYSDAFVELAAAGKVPIAVFANDKSYAAAQMLPEEHGGAGSRRGRSGEWSVQPSKQQATKQLTDRSTLSRKFSVKDTPLQMLPTLPVLLTNPGPDYALERGDYILYIPSSTDHRGRQESQSADGERKSASRGTKVLSHADSAAGDKLQPQQPQPQPADSVAPQMHVNPLPKLYRVQAGVARASSPPAEAQTGEKGVYDI